VRLAVIRGHFSIFAKNHVDDRIIRVNCAPAMPREGGINLHKVCDEDGYPQHVFALDNLGRDIMNSEMSPYIRAGSVVHYTGNWESMQLAWADKDFHKISMQPYVYDTTLPQHRLGEGEVARPLNDEYPVWYFLTGQIAHPEKLQALWKLNTPPHKRSAHVNGLMSIIYRNDRATVESYKNAKNRSMDQTVGSAYLVMNRLAEERLRYFKTHYFQVVRCKIALHTVHKHGRIHEVNGLTFVPSHGEEALQSVPCAMPRECMLDGKGKEVVREPSTLLHGYKLAGPEDEDHEGPPSNSSFVFPIIKEGRKCTGREILARRNLLLSPNRPISPLVSEVRAPSLPPTPESMGIGDEDVPLFELSGDFGPIGGHLRDRERRGGSTAERPDL
jgi:hypothetical protein